jgi:short-subunit dehydrogenase
LSHILITGASSGIGAALARLYAAPGVRLSLHGRSAERLAAVAAEAENRGAVVTTATGDVAEAAAMEAWIAAADRLQPIDLVIANAGISGGTAADKADGEPVAAIFAVNLNGVLNTVHPAMSPMLRRGRGQIAIMSSLAGFRGLAGSRAYGASKAAVRVYGEALRADLAPPGIGVSVICPGFVKTPMTDVNPFPMPFLMSPEKAARIIAKGLRRNRARIAFPWVMHLLVRILALLPQDWVDRRMARWRKPPFDGQGVGRL